MDSVSLMCEANPLAAETFCSRDRSLGRCGDGEWLERELDRGLVLEDDLERTEDRADKREDERRDGAGNRAA